MSFYAKVDFLLIFFSKFFARMEKMKIAWRKLGYDTWQQNLYLRVPTQTWPQFDGKNPL
jgi:hypothetical protein